MKRFSKGWYRLVAYAVVGRIPDTEHDGRVIVTHCNLAIGVFVLKQAGYANVRNYPMGQIKELSGTQAQSVNTFKIEQF